MNREQAVLAIEKKQQKRRRLATILICFVMPLVIAASVLLFRNEKYMLAATILLFLTMLPFFAIYEGKRPRAREMVLLAMITALVIAAQGIFGRIAGVQAGSGLIILSGIALGPEAGFLIGALSRFLLNFFQGQGPWTPWQMFCWGILGFLSGFCFQRPGIHKKMTRDFQVVAGPVVCMIVAEILAYLSYLMLGDHQETFWGWRLYAFGAAGLLAGLLFQRKRLPADDITIPLFTAGTIFVIYGGIMNLCALVTSAGMEAGNGISLQAWKALYISGAPYDAVHAVTAAIFNFVVGNRIIQRLERIKIKYGIYR